MSALLRSLVTYLPSLRWFYKGCCLLITQYFITTAIMIIIIIIIIIISALDAAATTPVATETKIMIVNLMCG